MHTGATGITPKVIEAVDAGPCKLDEVGIEPLDT